jgi:alpha-L-rhamnosidase
VAGGHACILCVRYPLTASPLFAAGLYAPPHPRAHAVVIDTGPADALVEPVWAGTRWPASWVRADAELRPPVDVLYRCRFTLDAPATLRLHVSGDERYELRINGQRVGRGPQRSDQQHWSFETYDVELEAGEHVALAWVSSPGPAGFLAPSAQLTRRHGLLLSAEGLDAALLNTGVAAWEAQVVTGVTHRRAPIADARFAGGTQAFDGTALPWAAVEGGGDGWRPVVNDEPAQAGGHWWGELQTVRPMLPARLPAMVETLWPTPPAVRFVGPDTAPVDLNQHDDKAAGAWSAMLAGGAAVVVPARTQVDVLLDWRDYVCAYPELRLDGGAGAAVELYWAEALYADHDANSHQKGHRDRVGGRFFRGKGDRVVCDGEARTYAPLWWRCGRYARLRIRTADAPLRIAALRLHETRYPAEPLPLPRVGDADLHAALPIMQRAILVCAQETFADSPYYEQLI